MNITLKKDVFTFLDSGGRTLASFTFEGPFTFDKGDAAIRVIVGTVEQIVSFLERPGVQGSVIQLLRQEVAYWKKKATE